MMTVTVASVFFFQAEDGIRDGRVTGVQTCALPILRDPLRRPRRRHTGARSVTPAKRPVHFRPRGVEIGRASCRERVEISVVAVSLTKKLKGLEGGTKTGALGSHVTVWPRTSKCAGD